MGMVGTLFLYLLVLRTDIPVSGWTIRPISIIGGKKDEGREEMTDGPGTPLTPSDTSEDARAKKNNKFIWTLKVQLYNLCNL